MAARGFESTARDGSHSGGNGSDSHGSEGDSDADASIQVDTDTDAGVDAEINGHHQCHGHYSQFHSSWVFSSEQSLELPLLMQKYSESRESAVAELKSWLAVETHKGMSGTSGHHKGLGRASRSIIGQELIRLERLDAATARESAADGVGSGNSGNSGGVDQRSFEESGLFGEGNHQPHSFECGLGHEHEYGDQGAEAADDRAGGSGNGAEMGAGAFPGGRAKGVHRLKDGEREGERPFVITRIHLGAHVLAFAHNFLPK